MTRAAKRIFITAVTTAMLLVLAFAATGTDAGAALKPLEKGQYFKAGYCIRPGEGYGPNAGYEVMDAGDSFMYNNEYISTTGNPGSGGRWNGDPGDPMYTQPVNVTYALMEKRYIGYPNGMRGDYYLPDGYLEYGAYCFKLMPGKYYQYPDSLYYHIPDRGKPWGVQIIKGDGTKEHPFHFGILFSEPYSVDVDTSGNGTVDVKPNAEAGETININVKPDLGYEIDRVTYLRHDGITPTVGQLIPDAEGNCKLTMTEADVNIYAAFTRKPGLAGITKADGSLQLYDTLADALPNWKKDTKLTLYEGAAINKPIEVNDKRVLDLNGYALVSSGKAFEVKSGGDLTILDSKPGRHTTFNGKDYTGGHIVGTVDGTQDTATGLIEVTGASLTVNGGSFLNQSTAENKWALAAGKASALQINDGYFKATKGIIMARDKDITVRIAGGIFEIEKAFPIEMIGPFDDMDEYAAAYRRISVSGGYYKGAADLETYPPIAPGYQAQRKADQIDWKQPDCSWRVADSRQPYPLAVSEEIEHGAVHLSDSVARPGDVVMLTAEPVPYYQLKEFLVTDAGGDPVTVTDGSFLMPASAITVNALFEEIPVSKIRLNKTEMTLSESAGERIDATPTPLDVLHPEITWRSENPAVASVNEEGFVQAEGLGRTKIIASAAGGTVTASCTVTVQHVHRLTRYPANEANCVQEGNVEYWECNRGTYACGRIYTDEEATHEIAKSDTVIPIDGDKHGQIAGFSTTQHVLNEQTCTSPLVQAVITNCEDCGKEVSIMQQGQPPKRHDWGEWQTVTPASADEAGEEKRVCKNDPEHVQTRIIPAGNHKHSLTKIEADPGTCTQPGNIEHWKCTGGSDPCGRCFEDSEGEKEIENVETFVRGHVLGAEVRENPAAADCETPATYEAVFYCKREGCGKELSRKGKTEGSALGHEWSEWESVDESRHKRVCKRNGDHVDIQKHCFDDGRVIAPTCQEIGKTVYSCPDCGYVAERNLLPVDPDAHVFGDATYQWGDENDKVAGTHTCIHDGTTVTEVADVVATEVAPTCDEAGYTLLRAAFENEYFEIQSKKIPGAKAKGHRWNAGKVTKKATVKKAGVLTKTCAVCGDKKKVAIPKAGTVIKGKTVKLKEKKLRKKAKTVVKKKAFTIRKQKGAVTYTKVSVKYKKAKSVRLTKKQLKKYRKTIKKKFTIAKKKGKIVVRKGLKKGTYKLRVKVRCKGNKSYAAYTKTVTVTIRVR